MALIIIVCFCWVGDEYITNLQQASYYINENSVLSLESDEVVFMNIISDFFQFSKLKMVLRAFREYRLSMFVLGALIFFSGLLEGIGVNAIIPLFSFAGGEQPASVNLISRTTEKLFLFFNLNFNFKSLLFLIIALFIVKAFMFFHTNQIAAKISHNYEKQTRIRLFKATIEASWPYLARQKIGYLDHILTVDIAQSASLLQGISAFILAAVNLFVYILVLINVSPVVALSIFVGGILILIAFKSFFNKNFDISAEIMGIYKQLAHFVNENIIGMKVIKSMFVEGPVIAAGKEYFNKMEQLSLRLAFVRNLTNAAVQPAGVIFILILFSFFYKAGNFNFGVFAVIIYAIQRIFSQIQAVQSQIHGISSQFPALVNTQSYERESLKHQETDDGVGNFRFDDRLEFKNVDFAYDDSRKAVSGLNFFLKKGQIVGLIGSSGSGKTTVVDLLLGLLRPQKGAILLDGENALNIKIKDWRENIGYVPQDAFLINDTIENNIKFYESSITDEEMAAVAKMANIYEFIIARPQKFQSMVGERGVALSGGQRQRIALARVLVRKPKILVLDEATSALDNESEFLIQKTLESLRGKITIVIIAHRLSTVMIADNLIILEKGKIIESGSPENLLQNENSYFHRNYNLMEIKTLS